MIDLSRYVFEALRRDEESILYPARRTKGGSQVLVLSPALHQPAQKSLDRLEHEYSLKEELDPNWAVQPIALTTHWDRTALVLRDSGGIPLSHLLGQAEDVCPFVQQAGSAAFAEASNGQLIF